MTWKSLAGFNLRNDTKQQPMVAEAIEWGRRTLTSCYGERDERPWMHSPVNEPVVVTHEEFAPAAKRKVPKPNVCVDFDVEYINTFEMLRRLEERFVRGRKPR